MLTRIYNNLVNGLSFTGELRSLRQKINISIDLPEYIEEFPDSHPKGFIKEFRKRRTTIAETYLRITKSLDSARYSQRVQALRLLAEHITYSRSLKMPLNAARVQLAIMKAVVQNRHDKRKQLELMHDFSVSSFGHPRAIRRYLRKFNLVEVPETGKELCDLNMGWDFHVHDKTSYGYKLPSQLIIDAFIKGISELTVVYNNLDEPNAVKEVLEAGKIMGIKVNIALEFSAMNEGRRFHLMYTLPEFSSKKGRFKKFLKQRSNGLEAFLDELEANEKNRRKNLRQLIEQFNKLHLAEINAGYEPGSVYYLGPVSIDDDKGNMCSSIFSRRQLGEFLYPRMKDVLEKRLMRAMAHKIRVKKTPEHFSPAEIEKACQKYAAIRDQYRNLDPEKLRLAYFSDQSVLSAETAVSSLQAIYKLSKKSGGSIRLIQPLEHGLQAAVNMILEEAPVISQVELFNTVDTLQVERADFILFAQFINLLNGGDKEPLTRFLDENQLEYKKSHLADALDVIRHRKIIPVAGSDAAGTSTLLPGMGFIFSHRIPKRQQKDFRQHHMILPAEISEQVFHHMGGEHGHDIREKPDIICLGALNYGKQYVLTDESDDFIHLSRAWEYLNPLIKNLFFVMIGFIPAYLTVGLGYAIIWFCITGFRNIFVDVISGKGFTPREWSLDDVSWTNLAQSLFFTGLSVPILGFVKSRYDIVWTGPQEGMLYEVIGFFFINITNGAYIASHNYLRGFDKSTIRANFFRSVMAWPLATLFAPVGNFMLVPRIVQAKFWSDVVAAFVEGTGKYRNILQVKKQVMKKLVPDLLSKDEDEEKLALLDMLYFLKESKRSGTALIRQLVPELGFWNQANRIVRRKKRRHSRHLAFYAIKKKLDRNDTFSRLSDFVVTHYNRQQSLVLLNMLSEEYH
ncbi:MAG: hypothetical protein R6X09_04240, partial [Bacteroidales bacterium]